MPNGHTSVALHENYEQSSSVCWRVKPVLLLTVVFGAMSTRGKARSASGRSTAQHGICFAPLTAALCFPDACSSWMSSWWT